MFFQEEVKLDGKSGEYLEYEITIKVDVLKMLLFKWEWSSNLYITSGLVTKTNSKLLLLLLIT